MDIAALADRYGIAAASLRARLKCLGIDPATTTPTDMAKLDALAQHLAAGARIESFSFTPVITLEQRTALLEDPAHKAGSALKDALAIASSALFSSSEFETLKDCILAADPQDGEVLSDLAARWGGLEADIEQFVAQRRAQVLLETFYV
jgi:hypothetical protein